MWRMKALAISVVVLGALLFGAVVAFAGWTWNAKVDVGGTVISTAWNVDGANEYKAKIKVSVPEEADLALVEIASDVERVKLRHDDDLNCTADGIETTVEYKIKPKSGHTAGEAVTVTVSVVGGEQLASAVGVLKKTITLNVLVPGTC